MRRFERKLWILSAVVVVAVALVGVVTLTGAQVDAQACAGHGEKAACSAEAKAAKDASCATASKCGPKGVMASNLTAEILNVDAPKGTVTFKIQAPIGDGGVPTEQTKNLRTGDRIAIQMTCDGQGSIKLAGIQPIKQQASAKQ